MRRMMRPSVMNATTRITPWQRGQASGSVSYTLRRYVLIHAYDVVDLDEVWRTASQEVPDLRRALDRPLSR
jgi:uncharacterized protein with HEPN domain